MTLVETKSTERRTPVKKSKRSRSQGQPRRGRSRRKKCSTERPRLAVRTFREQLRESLLEQIRGSVAATARQLVEDEVQALVGEPWSRKGDCPRQPGVPHSSRAALVSAQIVAVA